MTVSHVKGSGETWTVTVSGRLDQSQGPTLEQTLVDLVSEDASLIIVDLTETTYINSGGLRILVTSWRRLRQGGGDLILVGLSDRLMEVFRMVGFDKVFRIMPTVADATRQPRNGN